MNKAVRIGLIVAGGVASIALGALTRHFVAPVSTLSPEALITQALTNSLNASSIKYHGTITAAQVASTSTTLTAPAVITFSGATDTQDLKNPKADFSLSLALPKALMEDGLTGTLTAEIGVRSLQKKFFLIVKQFPPDFFFDLEPILNSWISFDVQDVSQAFTEATTTIAYDAEATAEFKTALAHSGILQVTTTKGSEVVEGVASEHYAIRIHKTKLIAFLPTAESYFIKLDPTQAEKIRKDMAEYRTELEKTAPEEFPVADLWIDPVNQVFTKIEINKLAAEQNQGAYKTPAVRIVFSLFLSEMNMPIVIDEPTPTISFQEAFKRVMSAAYTSTEKEPRSGVPVFFSDEQTKSRNTQRKANINAILNAVGQNMADNRGTFVCKNGPIPSKATLMQKVSGYILPELQYDIAPCLVPTYLPSMPFDPGGWAYWTSTSLYRTGYTIMRSPSSGRVTVSAPDAEGEVISVTR